MFHKTYSYSGINNTLNFISSIWDDDCIVRLDDNKWKCLWRDIKFQGINATNALDNVLLTRGMCINSFLVAIYKDCP